MLAETVGVGRGARAAVEGTLKLQMRVGTEGVRKRSVNMMVKAGDARSRMHA